MTDNKLADALRDIQQYLQMTAPSPDCGHLLQITVDALAEHDAHEVEKAKPDGDYVLVPEVTDEDIEAACRAYCGDMNPDTITNYSGVPVWKLYETECRAVIESYRARRLLASAEQGAK